MKEIILRDILNDKLPHLNNLEDYETLDTYIDTTNLGDKYVSIKDILIVMKEACRQTLELAAENATHYTVFDDEPVAFKSSILDTINQIK